MRRTPTGLRQFRLGSGFVLTILALYGPAATVEAQTEKAKSAGESVPLGRYVPADFPSIYIEHAGLDEHADAWHKTAAYKLLTETSLGAMLEDIATQYLESRLPQGADRKVTGAEVLKFVEHMARSGFLFSWGEPPQAPGTAPPAILVIRGAYRKEIKGITGRILRAGDPKAKLELSKRPTGRSIVVETSPGSTQPSAWWVEHDDLILVTEVSLHEKVTEALDGKVKSVADHPTHQELVKPEGEFEPVLVAYADVSKLRTPVFRPTDLRWGISGDAIQSIVRVKSKRPRTLMGVLDAATFDAKSLPVVLDGVSGFTAFSLDYPKMLSAATMFVKGANPAAGAALDEALEQFRTKSRLQVDKDLLGNLGKAVFYTLPPLPPTAAAKKAAAAAAAAAAGKEAEAPNPFMALFGPGGPPRAVLLVEVKNHAAFEKGFDALMVIVNQQLRTRFKVAASKDDEPGALGDDTPKRRGETVSPEFRMMPGSVKSYVLNVPSGVAKLPPGVRPAIRLGPKSLVLATSPELARQAMDVIKGTGWTPPAEFAEALAKAPSNLAVLNLSDPRTQTPKLLANLPAQLQQSINAWTSGAEARGGKPPGMAATGPGGGATPGDAPPAGAAAPGPGVPGAPGVDPAQNASPGFQLHVASSKLPSADALKALMFPGTLAVTVTDDEIRLVVRDAFPDLVLPLSGMGGAIAGSLVQRAAAMAPGPKPVPGADAAKKAAEPASKK